MGLLEIGALVLTGAGTLGSVLGLFYSYASKENGKLTRAMMKQSDDETRELITTMHQDNKRFHDENKALLQGIKEFSMTAHDENKALLQGMNEFSMTAHDENKALLAAIVELLKKNGAGR